MTVGVKDFMDNVEARQKRNATKINRNVVVRATLTHSDIDTGTAKRQGTTSTKIRMKEQHCA